MSSAEFVVYGDPIPQGSKIPVVDWVRRKVWLRDDNANALDRWRKTVSAAGREAMIEHGIAEPLDGPLTAAIVFTLPRPKSAPKRRWPHTRPDLDKLLRAVFDALKTAGVIADDARVVMLEHLAKVYPGAGYGLVPAAAVLNRPGVWIRIHTLTPDQETIPL